MVTYVIQEIKSDTLISTFEYKRLHLPVISNDAHCELYLLISNMMRIQMSDIQNPL